MFDTRTAPYGTLALRVGLGAMFIAHSVILKLMVFTLPGTAQFFASIGLPGALAYLVFAAEAVGGVLLILGVGTRWIALALMPILVSATWVHAGNGWVFSNQGGGWEYPVFLILVSAVQAALGDGAWALGPKLWQQVAAQPAARGALS
jgi:putative oxidoreductase